MKEKIILYTILVLVTILVIGQLFVKRTPSGELKMETPRFAKPQKKDSEKIQTK